MMAEHYAQKKMCRPTDKSCVTKDGQTVANGQQYKDDCNTCTCSDGQSMCTLMGCVHVERKSCKTGDGKIVADGATYENACNKCVCNDGISSCTLMGCIGL